MISNPPAENRRVKVVLWTSAIVLVLAATAAGIFGRPAYKRYKEARSASQARRFLAASDFRNASISARQALLVNPRSIEASRVMAELAEVSNSPLLIHWRQQVAELDPSLSNKLLLARAALRVQAPPYALSAQILEETAAAGVGSAAFQCVAAELALKLKNPGKAETCFAAALLLEPANESHALNLAVLRLRSTNQVLAAEAQSTLDRIATSTNAAPLALRWLIGNSIDKPDLAAAEAFSLRLLSNNRATFHDRLLHAAILKRVRPGEFKPWVEQLKEGAATNTAQIQILTTWLISMGMVDEAHAWISRLSPNIRSEQPVPLAVASCYFARSDWAGLESFLQGQSWGDIEFLRYAYLSQVARKAGQAKAASSRWTMAMQKAGDHLSALTLLANMASGSETEAAREEILWAIVRRHPRQRWVFRELEQHYVKSQNTIRLQKLYSTMASYEPNDQRARNNFAATSLLLGRDTKEAHQVARELYASHPEDAVIASTYAYSLHLQGRTRSGLAVLEKLSPARLETPPVALYYGVMLAADEQREKAGRFLGMVRAEALLPEESQLISQATAVSAP